MEATIDLTGCLNEIRRRICDVCPERPEGGPPCEPLGKSCVVERSLPELIDVIESARKGSRRQCVCGSCPLLEYDHQLL